MRGHMMEVLQFLLMLASFTVPLALGWFIGGSVERSHIANLTARENVLRAAMVVTQTKQMLYPTINHGHPPTMLTAEVVIASDYLKTFLASFRRFFGGEIRSYQRMLDRARREATLRLIEEAQRRGYNAVNNVRLQPCEIGGPAAMAVIIASGTAYHSGIMIRDEFGEGGKPGPAKQLDNPYEPLDLG